MFSSRTSNESDEEPHDFGVSVGEPDLVPFLVAFGPVEHATCCVKRLVLPREPTPGLLSGEPSLAMSFDERGAAERLPTVHVVLIVKSLMLLRRQFDVANPDAH